MSQRSCSVEGCPRPFRCPDFCKVHYDRWLKHGSPFTVLRRGQIPISARGPMLDVGTFRSGSRTIRWRRPQAKPTFTMSSCSTRSATGRIGAASASGWSLGGVTSSWCSSTEPIATSRLPTSCRRVSAARGGTRTDSARLPLAPAGSVRPSVSSSARPAGSRHTAPRCLRPDWSRSSSGSGTRGPQSSTSGGGGSLTSRTTCGTSSLRNRPCMPRILVPRDVSPPAGAITGASRRGAPIQEEGSDPQRGGAAAAAGKPPWQ